MQPEDIDGVEAAAAAPLEPPIFLQEPEPERVPFWDYIDLALMIGLLFALLVLADLAGMAWVHFHPETKANLMDWAFPLQFGLYILIYLCFRLVFKLRYGRPVFESLGWRKSSTNLLVAGGGGVLLAFAIDMVASFIHTPKVNTPFDQLVKTPLSMFLLALLGVVIGPLFEEMVFRGFLQPLFSRTVGAAMGILFTGLLFGSLHGPEYEWAWQYVAAISTVGIVLGVLRERTNSIIPGTILHGCFNSVSVVALVAQKYFTHK